MKSSRSIQSSRVKGTRRLPADGSSGLLGTSISSTRPSGKSSTTILRGFSTAKRRGAVRLRTLRTACSSMPTSATLSALATPTMVAKSRSPSAGKPRRRRPETVGMRGSSQPRTCASSTRRKRKRFDRTVWVRLSRANSYWRGREGNRQVVDEPVVERPMVLELQRAQGMRDALDRVGLPVREVVGRVDAPRITRARMLRVEDPVQDRVAQVHIGGRHVDPCAQHARAVGELAGAHALEEVEILFDRPLAPWALSTRLGERAPVLTDLVGGEVVDVGLAGLDEVDRPLVELLEVARRIVEVLAPVEPQPADVGLDGVDVLLLFLHGVGVVEAQVAAATELLGDTEVDVDRLHMADVEVAVRLGGEAGDDGLVPALAKVGGDDLADEVATLGRGWRLAVHVGEDSTGRGESALGEGALDSQ